MEDTSRSKTVLTKQQRIAELARQMPDKKLTSLSQHIDLDWMREAYRRTRKDGAVGIDGQSAEAFAEELESNLQTLIDQAKSGRYRAPAVRRVRIPKGKGKETRPIGIPTFADKVLQRSIVMALEPIYEQDFLDCSYGFRPGRSAHQALEAIWKGMMGMGGGWVVDLDIRSFFDEMSKKQIQDFVSCRVTDGVIKRLIGKWLNAGVMEEGQKQRPVKGTPQGGVASPLLANIYLHEVLDLWFEREVRPRMNGRAFMIRYADDALMCFERKEDAQRVLAVLPKRLERFELSLHAEKTRLVKFKRPSNRSKGPPHDRDAKPGTFSFLGFIHYWDRSRRGNWVVKRRTMKERFSRALSEIALWCRKARHLPVREQHRILSMKLRGHDAYYGITGNGKALANLRFFVKRIWRKWLNRRSQRAGMSWDKFEKLYRRYPFPPAAMVAPSHARSANP